MSVYGCAVSPRKNGPVVRWKLEPVDDLRADVARRVDLQVVAGGGRDVDRLGSAAGSSPGITFARIVRVLGRSRLRNA
ncbi:MAG TPA: hypothetical protein VFJ60_01185 [Gaiella sp.]|nr:hypothetical protein [Gaiella sp.]